MKAYDTAIEALERLALVPLQTKTQFGLTSDEWIKQALKVTMLLQQAQKEAEDDDG